MTIAELAEVTGGRLAGLTEVEAAVLLVTGPVVTDSREASAGSLYVARVGEHQDGHDFVAPAAEAGAVASLTSREVADFPCVVVEDVQAAFVALARRLIDRSPGLNVVGITGSSGKTSTKDLLAAVLATDGETVAPVGSLNSEVGVPLTVCRVTPSTRHLVVEMGARGAGHIDYLTRIAPPRIGVVLNVGVAHVGEFGSPEAIGAAKSELVRALPPDGVAVLNADDPVVAAMAEVTRARVVTVGRAADATFRATDVVLDGESRPSFTLRAPAGEARVSLQLHGEHHVGNALAVLAVALESGLSLEAAVEALRTAVPGSRWRMEVTHRPDGVVVVNDAYNANPDSMAAALRALAAMGTGRRTWAVLGSMLELGDHTDEAHRAIGELAVHLGVDRVLVVGDVARPILTGVEEALTRSGDGSGRASGAGEPTTSGAWVADADAAWTVLEAELAAPDVVLFKSSRDAGLRWLGDRVAGKMEDPQ